VYAAFDNHKTGDFKPYVLKSTDRGVTWTSIGGDLPPNGSSYAVVEDHVDPKLLFAGTEYGLFFSQDGGGKWLQLKGNFPTVAVRDLWIQKRRNDLVVGTFGRGIYILDDYRPLRTLNRTSAKNEATLFPTRDAELYVERTPLGLPQNAFQGNSYFAAPNPDFGANFTYYLKDEIKTLKKQRWQTERDNTTNEPTKPPQFPTWEQLRAEQRELEPAIVLTVSDDDGNVVRRVTGPVTAGFHRVAWDLRYPPPSPIDLEGGGDPDPFSPPPGGPLAAPGTYTVRLAKRVDGVETNIGEPQTFNVVPLYLSVMGETDRAAVLDYQRKASRLQKAVMGAARANEEALQRVAHIRQAIPLTETADAQQLSARLTAVERKLQDIDVELNGDTVIAGSNEPTLPAIVDRMTTAVNGLTTTAAPTQTHREALARAEADFVPLLARLKQAVEVDLRAIEQQLNAAGAPWTPGRIPEWKSN
jgi:hypothetical protein